MAGTASGRAISSPQATSTLKLTITCSLIVVAVNIVMGTLIAWLLVRDDFRGKSDCQLADRPARSRCPRSWPGSRCSALYGPKSPFGINAAYTQAGLVMALLLVNAPLRRTRRAAGADGAGQGHGGGVRVPRRVAPHHLQADCAAEPPPRHSCGHRGSPSHGRWGEFGAVVLISGNIPFETQVSSVFIYSQVESGNLTGRCGDVRGAARRGAGRAGPDIAPFKLGRQA